MKHIVQVKTPNLSLIILELDDTNSPKTVNDFIEKLPFTVDLNVWGDEIYTSESPITQPEENAKSLVQLNDVAYWPTGKAICLFYGSTPNSDAYPSNTDKKFMHSNPVVWIIYSGINKDFKAYFLESDIIEIPIDEK